jgi:hypothetical protein
MAVPDLTLLLKVSARLLDLHDSRRTSGETTQYSTEERAGLGDGRYVAIGGAALEVLQSLGKRNGDEFSSLATVVQGVQASLQWAAPTDVEYVLNVLSRPTHLRLLHDPQDSPAHVIGDKETNLVEKAAHLSAFRLSRIGKAALIIALDHVDITYIEGDVTKLIRALEVGKLAQALDFIDRLIDQLRAEHGNLISLVERTWGGRRLPPEVLDELEAHGQVMHRAVELVETAQGRLDGLVRAGRPLRDETPVGLVRERIRELSRGIVRYARELSLLVTQTLSTNSTAVNAPSFAKLAQRWVEAPPDPRHQEWLLDAMGPAYRHGFVPMGTDFAGVVRPRNVAPRSPVSIDLSDFELPPEHQFIGWLRANRDQLVADLEADGIDLGAALARGMGELEGTDAIGCLVAALTAPDQWTDQPIAGSLKRDVTTSAVVNSSMVHTRLQLRKGLTDSQTE